MRICVNFYTTAQLINTCKRAHFQQLLVVIFVRNYSTIMTNNPKEIDLSNEQPAIYNLPEVKIEELQLELNCGFNMLDKKIQITIYGQKKIELPVISLSQMYKFLINVNSLVPKETDWYVTHLIIKPCQQLNYPISVGINIITGMASFAFSFLLSYNFLS